MKFIDRILNSLFEFTDKFIDKHFKNEKTNSLLKKIINREMFDYILFGVLTTVVSFVTLWIFNKLFGLKYYLLNNVLSWIISVAFAFITNKLFVFHSESTEKNTLIKEIVSFTSARLLSLGVEEAGLAIAQFVFHVDDTGAMIAKLIMQIIVVIMNYFLSKLFIFKDKKDKN